MANKYVSFISDKHMLDCVSNLYTAYTKAKKNLTKENFYANKIDVIKLTFDASFNDLDEESLVKSEVLRQIDKSINNSIGTFHEQIIGGIQGYQVGNLSGFDIRAIDNTLFADIKNKHNTMNSNSAEALFQKLANYANTYKKAQCYWVQILAKTSFDMLWQGEINGKEYSHSRVRKISGDQFYALASKQDNALAQLYSALPTAIKDFMQTLQPEEEQAANSALSEIEAAAKASKRNILDQITFENYSYYLGFDKL